MSVEGIGTVFAVLTNLEKDVGQVVLTCGSDSWSCLFTGMRDRTVAEYIWATGTDYLERCLGVSRLNSQQRKCLRRALALLKTEVIPLCL